MATKALRKVVPAGDNRIIEIRTPLGSSHVNCTILLRTEADGAYKPIFTSIMSPAEARDLGVALIEATGGKVEVVNAAEGGAT